MCFVKISPERRQLIRTICTCGAAASLVGCGVINTLNAPPAPAQTAVPPARFEIIADKQLNPDHLGVPKPVLLRIYELKAAATFDRSSFFDLQDKDGDQLGNDYVRREELLIYPGQRLTLELKGNPEVRAFGLLSAYRNIERSTWRASIPSPNSTELRRRWWGLGPTQGLQTVNYHVNLTRDAVEVQVQPAEK